MSTLLLRAYSKLIILRLVWGNGVGVNGFNIDLKLDKRLAKLCEPFGIWYLVFGIWFLVTGISSQPILGLGSWREESLPWHCLESNGYAAWRP